MATRRKKTQKDSEVSTDTRKKKKDMLGRIRENPWILATFVLGALLLGSLIFAQSGVSVASESLVGDKVTAFLNTQVDGGEVTVSSIEHNNEFYTVMVSYLGRELPVYASLSGDYIFSDLVPTDATEILSVPPAGSTSRVTVEIGNAPFKGNNDAPITLVEFSDYQCPFCARFYAETLPQLYETYIATGKVKLVFMDFPLSIHPQAQKASEAARCFAAQGEDYFAYHDVLFERQAQFSVVNFKAWARELGATDGGLFDACLDSGTYEQDVIDSFMYGQELGVTGTPAFFMNGKLISGAQPFAVFEQHIENELAAKAG